MKEVILSIIIFVIVTIYEGILLCMNPKKYAKMHKTKYHDGPPQILSPTVIDYEFLNFDHTRMLCRDNIPFIVKDIPSEYLEEIDKIYQVETSLQSEDDGLLTIREYMFPYLGCLKSFIVNLTGHCVLYMASFSGTYKSGYAHIDAGASYNFYYVKRGIKSVIIVPTEHNDYINFQRGKDSVYCSDDSPDGYDGSWLENVPSYYKFDLTEGEVLVFNNSACVHKFSNVTGREHIYTIRCTSTYSDARTLKNDIFNWSMAKCFASNVLSCYQKRDTSQMR